MSNYAQLSTRVKAAIVDGIILMLLIYFSGELLSLFNNVPNTVRATIFVFIFFLYEPILISIFGATVGHFFNDIVVKRENNEQRNISFPFAILRFALKAALGWLSLITISGNPKGKAIHDFVGKSVVKNYEK